MTRLKTGGRAKQKKATYVGAAAVHLEGAHSGDDDDAVGLEAGVAALDVEKLFHANVGAKAATSRSDRKKERPPPTSEPIMGALSFLG